MLSSPTGLAQVPQDTTCVTVESVSSATAFSAFLLVARVCLVFLCLCFIVCLVARHAGRVSRAQAIHNNTVQTQDLSVQLLPEWCWQNDTGWGMQAGHTKSKQGSKDDHNGFSTSNRLGVQVAERPADVGAVCRQTTTRQHAASDSVSQVQTAPTETSPHLLSGLLPGKCAATLVALFLNKNNSKKAGADSRRVGQRAA